MSKTDTSTSGFPKDVLEAAERLRDRLDEDDPVAEIAEAVLQSDSDENREARS